MMASLNDFSGFYEENFDFNHLLDEDDIRVLELICASTNYVEHAEITMADLEQLLLEDGELAVDTSIPTIDTHVVGEGALHIILHQEIEVVDASKELISSSNFQNWRKINGQYSHHVLISIPFQALRHQIINKSSLVKTKLIYFARKVRLKDDSWYSSVSLGSSHTSKRMMFSFHHRLHPCQLPLMVLSILSLSTLSSTEHHSYFHLH